MTIRSDRREAADTADHLLHYTPGAEGYGAWRLECVAGVCPQESGPNACWTISWFEELGADCIHGDDWPEDVMPLPVAATYRDGLQLRFAG